MNKKLLTIILGLLLIPLSVYAGGDINAMKWRGSGGWSNHSKYCRMYNPASIETLKGEVVDVTAKVHMEGMEPGTHLTLKTGDATREVHLGPVWFMERQDIVISKGDKIEVSGSRIMFEGEKEVVLMAASLTKGEKMFQLRDDKGRGLWDAVRDDKK